jgi:competence protein ComEA
MNGPRGPHRAAWGALAACALALVLATGAGAAESQPGITGLVNINTASSAELQLLPGVGEVRAGAILAMRKQRGGFKQVDDLLEVKGIGPKMLKRLRPHATLTGKTTAREL